MPASALIALLEDLVTKGPQLTTDTVKLYSDIAHGEGGLAKVQQAVSDLGQLLADAAGVPASTPPASATTPTPAT